MLFSVFVCFVVLVLVLVVPSSFLFCFPPQHHSAFPPTTSEFWAEEVTRAWKGLLGVLKHLAVLKYMQIVQKHRRFAMQYFDVKNKKGTPLTLGASPHGLYLYRHNQLHKPVVTFSWTECSELAFTDKKFSIQVRACAGVCFVTTV